MRSHILLGLLSMLVTEGCLAQGAIPRTYGKLFLGMSETEFRKRVPTARMERCHECARDELLASLDTGEIQGFAASLSKIGLGTAAPTLESGVDVLFAAGSLLSISLMAPAKSVDEADAILTRKLGRSRDTVLESGLGLRKWDDNRTTISLTYIARQSPLPNSPGPGTAQTLIIEDKRPGNRGASRE
jgi:hypothetical protein